MGSTAILFNNHAIKDFIQKMKKRFFKKKEKKSSAPKAKHSILVNVRCGGRKNAESRSINEDELDLTKEELSKPLNLEEALLDSMIYNSLYKLSHF